MQKILKREISMKEEKFEKEAFEYILSTIVGETCFEKE